MGIVVIKKMQTKKLISSKWILILFGISGMAALVYEVTWIRPLSLVFGNTTYAVSTIIASFIFGLGMGSWIAGKYTDRIKNPFKYFGFTQIGIGVYGILLLGVFGILPGMYLDIYHATWPHQEFFTFVQIIISMGLLLVPTALMGATLPLLLKTYSQDLLSIGKDVGKLDASNSFGAMVGTLAAGFLLIPLLGIQNSIIFAASINIAIGIIILITKRFFDYKKLIILGVAIIFLFLLIPSYDIKTLNVGVFNTNDIESSMIDPLFGYEEILFYEESLYNTILVIDNNVNKRLTINGKTQCNNNPYSINGTVNLAYIPFEVYSKNYGKPNNALNVGLACGTTAKVLSLNLNTTTIEIDPAIVDASKFFYPEGINQRLIIDDGRNWLYRNDEKFDLIIVEVFDPYVHRNSMYSQEFFSIQNNSLTENGIAVQWVPFYEMKATDVYIFFNTFNSVFPYVYAYQMEPGVLGHIIFLGSQKPLQLPENDLYMFDHDSLIPRETILSTDDNNFIEFSIARNIYNPPTDESELEIQIKKSN